MDQHKSHRFGGKVSSQMSVAFPISAGPSLTIQTIRCLEVVYESSCIPLASGSNFNYELCWTIFFDAHDKTKKRKILNLKDKTGYDSLNKLSV